MGWGSVEDQDAFNAFVVGFADDHFGIVRHAGKVFSRWFLWRVAVRGGQRMDSGP